MDDARDGASGTLMPATPPRFSIAHAPDASGVAHVENSELHHMRTVLRLSVGARVAMLDPAGIEHRGAIERYERDRAVIRIESSSPSPARNRIILAAAVIKGPRMDFLVEKAAELGAAELWPVLCARGVAHEVGGERLARWRRLATAAAKQSLAPRATEVIAPRKLEDLIQQHNEGRLCVVLSAGAPALGAVLREARTRALLLLCGPEGDFTDEEVHAVRAAGFLGAGLGGRRLRSETAALAALSIAAGTFDELDRDVSGED